MMDLREQYLQVMSEEKYNEMMERYGPPRPLDPQQIELAKEQFPIGMRVLLNRNPIGIPPGDWVPGTVQGYTDIAVCVQVDEGGSRHLHFNNVSHACKKFLTILTKTILTNHNLW